MINEILDFTKIISREAGEILLKGFRSEETIVSYKSRTDLVTNMDRASEDFLYSKINSKFPDHTIIAEEGSRKETNGEFAWYVDPLDATNNYAHGIPFFCVSIGVYSKDSKKVVAGAVYDPYHDEMFSAATGTGAFLNGKKITVSGINDIGIAVLATGFPYTKEDPEKNNVKQFNRILPNIQGIRRIGSAALDLSYISCGRIDGYWEPYLQPWDMAAGSVIVEEAGGRVSKYNGDTFDPEYPQIIASNGKIHDTIITMLSEVK
ncbi:MAG: inositol monophosphatase [bacterium]|nr:inositol monophosphatase [bacterium]